MTARLAALALGLALVLCAAAARAHSGGVTGFATLDVAGNALRYRLTLSELPPALRGAQDPARAVAGLEAALRAGLSFSADGAPCALAGVTSAAPTPDRVSVSTSLDYVCAAPIVRLELRDDSFDALGADVHVSGRARAGAREFDFALATEAREARFAFDDGAAPAAPAAPGFAHFLTLGVEHILIGYDHLLFLLALLLVPGRLGSTVRIVTAFTLAHSVTLAIAALDLMRLSPALVEATIAASIAYVAAENLWARNPLSHRARVTALFGLVHGCGFASVLRGIGLPTDGLWPALLGFNLGVEFGQVLIVLCVAPLLHALARRPRGKRALGALSALVCAAGLWLVVARLPAL